MTNIYARLGLAGLVLFAGHMGAEAQEQGTPSAPNASACSGFMCLFSSHKASAPPAPPPTLAPVPAPAPVEAAAPSLPEPTTHQVKRIAKRVPTVTVAADAAEIAKLKGLAAGLPKTRIRFVETERAREKAGTDFTVSTAADDAAGANRAKLFAEQLHIVAGGTIRSMADLKDRKVSFGPAEGATTAAARKAFGALGIAVQEVPLDFNNAFDGLATGDIDAVVLLAPAPAQQIKELRSPGLHLVSWPDDAPVPGSIATAAVSSDTYPRLIEPGHSIRTVRVDAVLALNAKAAKKPEARSVMAALSRHVAALTTRGVARPEVHAERVLASSGDPR